MSKPIKALMRNELGRRLEGVESLAVVSLIGLTSPQAVKLRRDLKKQNIRVTVVKNSVARQALKEAGMTGAERLIEGPCALATGGESVVSVVRELLGRVKDLPALRVKGAFMEGTVFGPNQMDELSRYPTRQEARGQLVGLALSPGGRIVGALRGPGGRLGGMMKQEAAEKWSKQEAAAPEAAAAPAGEAPAGAASSAPAPQA